jgi:hypothetical protein
MRLTMHPPIPTGALPGTRTVDGINTGITGQGNGLSTRRVAFRNRPRAALEARGVGVRTRGLAFGGRRVVLQ